MHMQTSKNEQGYTILSYKTRLRTLHYILLCSTHIDKGAYYVVYWDIQPVQMIRLLVNCLCLGESLPFFK